VYLLFWGAHALGTFFPHFFTFHLDFRFLWAEFTATVKLMDGADQKLMAISKPVDPST
jgi:hypothetical protein